ncbi:Serine/threonine-protein kinase pkn1 [Pigmentiphaga humi]|uniref:Serine/threonine-protein kinase pkn1 n=1 Tax=Pigmentiphaga humi TaxID=2478468 RepID=A0A3P4B853_9BURK|nr:formylglycine-generating enzyme family protein [Pigmentiphaga humi]VCU72232.1 Serine/threonine-protein kinase pkn1 [Pigmentiphaga humi]
MAPLDAGARASSAGCCCGGRGPRPAAPAGSAPDPAHPSRLVRVPGGTFTMGSDAHYREERPARRVSVLGFRIDRYPVTNAEFRAFVAATGYVTTAERQPDPRLYPDADPALLAPGALVFVNPGKPVGLRDFRNWWAYVLGACWRHPLGPDSDLDGLDEHPVVQVSYEDARAYAAWAGKALPTEPEWEFAACGGLDGAVYPWGDEFMPGGQTMANTWQGQFPWQNTLEDGYERTSPVKSYPPNGYGLYDVAGNVWEWTATPFGAPPGADAPKSCCIPQRDDPSVRHVVKGGSHLCAPNYCLRYRPAARQGQTLDTATSHIGFRCVVRD